ncbi:MAG: hypothetical protein P4L53_24855 [Candidatus Obscuribacterales bacterium]|nr:hypothetical protein [Candidatus Obscuribacterales bacterium]
MNLVLLGLGNAAAAVVESARTGKYDQIIATTRSEEKRDRLEKAGLKVIFGSCSDNSDYISRLTFTTKNSHVFVSFPPDGQTDAILAPAVKEAQKIVYISTTGVFGGAKGLVDESTPVDGRDEKTVNRLEAEKVWRDIGAIILRAPGLYGPATGLHLRLKSGTYRLPGKGSNHISRIHLDDLASIALAAFERAPKSSLYVVGDESPVPQIEVVEFLCSKLNLPMPESISLEDAHATVRGDRQVVANRVLEDLGVTLKYPTYKQGYEQCLAATADSVKN